jgi:hypothetical protein
MEYTMKIAKTLSALSLALALQGGALIAATIALAPSDAVAAVSKKKAPKKSQKKAPARGKIKTKSITLPPEHDGPQDELPSRDPHWSKGIPKFTPPPPPSGNLPGPGECPGCANTAHKRK